MITIDKLSTIEKEELSIKLKINKSTLYRYRTEKKYLYKLIELGLQKEEELKHNINSEDDYNKIMENFEKRLNSLENEIKV